MVQFACWMPKEADGPHKVNSAFDSRRLG